MSSFFDKLSGFRWDYASENVLLDTLDHKLRKKGMFLEQQGYLDERRRVRIFVYKLYDRDGCVEMDYDTILRMTQKAGCPLDLRNHHPVEDDFYPVSGWLENGIVDPGNFDDDRICVNTVLLGKNAGKMLIYNGALNDDDFTETDGVWTPRVDDYRHYPVEMFDWENHTFLSDTDARRANEICPGIVRVDELQDRYDSD